MNELIELAQQLNCKYSENEPMSLHTTFKIGGNARLIVYPQNEKHVSRFVKKARKHGIRLIAVGRGSNLLVSDDGIDACVLILDSNMAEIRLADDQTVFAQAGASLMRVCKFAAEHELSGLEFAYGIPGSCGGAAFMNAGAYGGEMKDALIKCEHVAPNGESGALSGDEMGLSYRRSAYYGNGCIITGIYLKLNHGNRGEIQAKMDDFLQRRKDKQPLEYPSAGSTFKRPPGYFAGALIQDCNLMGRTVGGAQVSEKHAGFVINKGGATCQDVLDLCKICAETVEREKGIKLEMEIRVTR